MATLEKVDFDPFAPSKAKTPEEFASTYAPAAERAGKALGVDPKVLLAQWGLETGWGKSIIPGTNNLGNIKDFAGGGVAATDNMTGSRDKYRAYASPDAFADDYASLIQRKYPGAMGAGADPAKFTAGLKGYAEDPRYADKVAQATRMVSQNPLMAAMGKAVGAVIPSAHAETKGPTLQKVDYDPFAEEKSDSGFKQGAGNLLAGAVRGAGSIGATILAPYDMTMDALKGSGPTSRNQERRAAMDAGLETLGAQPDSWLYKGGKLGAEIAGTAGAGGVLAKPLQALAGSRLGAGVEPLLEGAARSLQTGGFRVGELAGTSASIPARIAGGAITGGAAAGMADPNSAGVGAMIGGGLPGAVQIAGKAGNVARNTLVGTGASGEVRALAQRAKDLGINIPADRLVNSRPLNAVASSLEYVPLSGRTGTLNKMEDQLNRALTRTFGQDSTNVTHALRTASDDLGSKFDNVLSQNTVRVDQQFMTDLADAANQANRELGNDGAGIISKQVDDILAKATSGDIDGQAAYNIKKTLDRIGKRNSPEAYYALDLKQKLMDALNRSLGSDQATAFKSTRQQYGNMLALEKIALNGAEGGISVARLANMKNINNKDLQELADISAQFLKPREGAHGSAQRAGVGAITAAIGGLPGLATGIGLGRGTNMLLNSSALKKSVMQPRGLLSIDEQPLGLLTQGAYRSAPLLSTD